MIRHALPAAAMLACAAVASARPTVPSATVFGQNYIVQRFDLTSVQWNNPFPNSLDPTISLLEAEGTYYAGNDRIFFSSDAQGERFDTWKNFVVAARFTTNAAGDYTGIVYERTLLINDALDPNLDGIPGPFNGWDLSPAGITVNTGAGFGGGGSLVTTDTDIEALRAFNLATGSTPESCPLPSGTATCVPSTGCSAANSFRAGCWFSVAPNTNNEDVTYVPGGNGTFFTVWQDAPFFIAAHDAVTGALVRTFSAANPLLGEPKGITFVPNSAKFPGVFRDGDGTVMVGYDDGGPGLGVYSLTGTLRGTLQLVTPGANGFIDAPPGGDDVYLFGDRADYSVVPMQIESVSSDAATGRLFITIQSDFLNNNFVYVLTPDTDSDLVPDFRDNCVTIANAGQADLDGDSVGDGCDNCVTVVNTAQADSNADGLGNACSCSGDADRSGGVSFADITTVLANFGASTPLPVVPPATASGDADLSGDVNFGDITTVLANFGAVCN
jgi:hypothetical protein